MVVGSLYCIYAGGIKADLRFAKNDVDTRGKSKRPDTATLASL